MLAELEQSPRWVSRWDWDLFSKFCQESQQIIFFLSRKFPVCWAEVQTSQCHRKPFFSWSKFSKVRAIQGLGFFFFPWSTRLDQEALYSLIYEYGSELPRMEQNLKKKQLQQDQTPRNERAWFGRVKIDFWLSCFLIYNRLAQHS